LDHEKVGVAFSTVSVEAVFALLKLTESVGENVAVITDVPPPVIVAVESSIVATDVWPDEYDQVPATDALSYVALGPVRANAESPKIFVDSASVPRVGVARVTVITIGALVSEL
jgi:hypothetical protein